MNELFAFLVFIAVFLLAVLKFGGPPRYGA